MGKRINLKHTRAMVDAIHNKTINDAEYDEMPNFGLKFPKKVSDQCCFDDYRLSGVGSW